MDIKLPRCPKGTRRNKRTGLCEKNANELVVAPRAQAAERTPQARTPVAAHTPVIVAAPAPAPPSGHSSKKTRAARTLKNFMFQKKDKITAHFLKRICSDSGVCIAFGKESDKIKKFFNNFTNFDYAVSRQRIGAPSVNGFVYEIEYARQDYFAHAILKSAIKQKSDNLMYEYTVGKTINTLFNNYFPCFLETYGVYKYNTEEDWESAHDGTNDKSLQDILTQYSTTDYVDSCINSKLLCILIQHIKNATTLHDKIIDVSNPRSYLNFFEKELLYCLYQVYYSLSMLSDEYTHYDLISSNILLYQPVDKKYIQYHYYLQDDTGTVNMVISFKSRYIVKIIDYGKSYVNGSMSYYNKICGIKECEPECGDKVGYQWLSPDDNAYFIKSSLSNKSHDLKLLNNLKIHFEHHKFINSSVIKLREIIDKTVYTGSWVKSDTGYVRKLFGTESNPTRGYPNRINNVVDAERSLRDMVLDPDEISKNNKYHKDNKFTKLGDLHVYGLLRKMKYVPA